MHKFLSFPNSSSYNYIQEQAADFLQLSLFHQGEIALKFYIIL